MTFEEACKVVKPGYYFKLIGNRWSEYTSQFGRDLDGGLFWTAGMTAGGPLTKDHIDPWRQTGYAIYAQFGDVHHIEPHQQVNRPKPPPETFYKTPEAPLTAELSLGCLHVKEGRDHVYNTYDLDELHALMKKHVASYPYLKVDPTGRQHLLVLSPTFHKFTPDEDKLKVGLGLLKAYALTQPKIEIPVLNPMKETVMEEVVEVLVEDTVEQTVQKQKVAFVSTLNALVDVIAEEEGPEQGRGARTAVSAVLETIDGKDGGPGYFLIEKADDLRMVPATKEAWVQMNEHIAFETGHDLSGDLADLFDGINS